MKNEFDHLLKLPRDRVRQIFANDGKVAFDEKTRKIQFKAKGKWYKLDKTIDYFIDEETLSLFKLATYIAIYKREKKL